MILGPLALAVAALFAGAALYVNVVEQPARMALAPGPLLAQWKPAYRLGTRMQAPLAIAGLVLAAAAWWFEGGWGWLVGGLLMGANWPWTLLVIMPVNSRLAAMDPASAGPEVHPLVRQWGVLHAGRTTLGLLAVAVMLWTIS